MHLTSLVTLNSFNESRFKTCMSFNQSGRDNFHDSLSHFAVRWNAIRMPVAVQIQCIVHLEPMTHHLFCLALFAQKLLSYLYLYQNNLQ